VATIGEQQIKWMQLGSSRLSGHNCGAVAELSEETKLFACVMLHCLVI